MKNRKGFTLMELVVVVMILGILASMGVPYYYKSIETTRAGDAVALGHLIGNANRMYALDHAGVYASGAITNSCNTSCASATLGTACYLVACGYVAQQDWSNSSYNFYACNSTTGGSCCTNSGSELAASCVAHSATGSTPYTGWGYTFLNSGRCVGFGTSVPPCPKF